MILKDGKPTKTANCINVDSVAFAILPPCGLPQVYGCFDTRFLVCLCFIFHLFTSKGYMLININIVFTVLI